jgi:hypothetical protein
MRRKIIQLKKAIGICYLLLVSFDVFLCSFFGTTTVKNAANSNESGNCKRQRNDSL